MFTKQLANHVIAPAAVGQPLVVRGPIHWAVHLILLNPAFFNACFAAIQLLIGFFMLWRKTAKYALWGSVVWGLMVWFGGEAMGGLANGSGMLLTGAPGAALLYAIIALAIMPGRKLSKFKDRPADWLVLVWAALWLGGAALQLAPGQNTPAGLATMISSMNSASAPHYLNFLVSHASKFVADRGELFIFWLVLTQALIGALVLLRSRNLRVAAIWLGIGVSLAFWLIGQSLGQYYSGLATDVSTAPLFILMGITILGTDYKMGDYIEGIV